MKTETNEFSRLKKQESEEEQDEGRDELIHQQVSF